MLSEPELVIAESNLVQINFETQKVILKIYPLIIGLLNTICQGIDILVFCSSSGGESSLMSLVDIGLQYQG